MMSQRLHSMFVVSTRSAPIDDPSALGHLTHRCRIEHGRVTSHVVKDGAIVVTSPDKNNNDATDVGVAESFHEVRVARGLTSDGGVTSSESRYVVDSLSNMADCDVIDAADPWLPLFVAPSAQLPVSCRY